MYSYYAQSPSRSRAVKLVEGVQALLPFLLISFRFTYVAVKFARESNPDCEFGHLPVLGELLFIMALRVEVAGYGLCQTAQPYSVFVVCVQQEKFEAWTVYRRYNSFQLLRDQLILHHPALPVIPHFDPDNLRLENLESCRVVLDRWLQMVASNSYILRMQSMYQFLCIDANMPPPYLEIHWRDSANGSFEEMEMDEMFDGRDEEDMDEDDDEDDEEEDDDEDDDEEEDEDEDLDVDAEDAAAVQQSVFGFAEGENAQPTEKKKRTASKGSGGAAKNKRAAQGGDASQHASSRRPQYDAAAAEMEEENDGLDIQSLSVVEAEFIYNKIDEGKPASQEVAEKKRTINLEAFKIIRVIGKGIKFSFGYYFYGT